MNRLRFVAKSLVHGAIDWSGRPRRCRQQLRGKLIILTYHSFCTDWPCGLFNSLPIHRFERQIQFLREHFKLVSLQQGMDYLQQGVVDDKPWVAITIDDGFRDNYTHAWPILQRYSVPATIFLATDFIDNNRPPWPIQLFEILERTKLDVMEYPIRADLKNLVVRSVVARHLKKDWISLSPDERFKRLASLRRHLRVDEETHYPSLIWNQIREMQARGLAFGSHTIYHSVLSEIESNLIQKEVFNAKLRIEEMTQTPCSFFAYPDGGHNLASKIMVKSAGYFSALTQDKGINTSETDLFLLNRLEVPFHDPLTTFKVRVSGCY